MLDRVTAMWELVRGRRRYYVAATVAIVLSSGLMYLSPVIRMWAIDHVIAGKPLSAPAPIVRFVQAVGGRSVLVRNLWIAGLAMLAVTALAGSLAFLKGYWAARASEDVVRNLRERLYDHLQHLRCAYHDRTDTGDLVQRCSSDVETVRLFLAVSATEIGRAGINIAVGVPIMLAISVKMTIAAVSLMPLILAYSVWFFLRVRKSFRICDEAEGRMTAVLEENLTGIRVVRAFARGEHESARFGERNRDYRTKWRRLVRLFSWFWSVSDLFCTLQIAVVMLLGAYLMVTGWGTPGGLSAGAMFAFMSFVHMFMWPIRQMGRVLADFGKASVALERINEVLDERREDAADPGGEAAFPGEGELAVEGLTYAHDGAEPVLRDVSFRVRPGETVALLGPSGSGKTTLVSLLLRLYEYEQGAIRLGGVELRSVPRKAVRRQFGTVLQEPFLYSKTLGDNIRLGGASEATDDAVAEAARAACVHDAISEFDKGYETLVGERGVTLSGGQRQRVALARAILADPPVLLLDDALSAVDTETEAMILDALRRRHGRKATLLIAHRLSTLMQADRILVLDHGRIVQRGTHGELVDADGLYRRLWRMQTDLEEDLAAEAGETRP